MSRPAASSVFAGGMHDDVEEATTWMQPMQRSWEEIAEDDSGGIKSTQLQQERERKKRLASSESGGGGGHVIEKGVIRYLYVIVDMSWAMDQQDMKPSRRAVTVDYLASFIPEFFDQNPLSHLGFIVCSRGVATVVTELSGNPTAQVEAIRALPAGGGEYSLQNALDLARSKLAQIPPYGSREILVLQAALGTTDPGDIAESIELCKTAHITASVIALAAEVYVCTLLATTTGGNCNVALSRDHYKSLLFSHIPPLPAHKASTKQKQARKWIHMGFPEQKYQPYPSLCACHEELRYGGYNCPKCLSKFCELPTECRVCALTLVSSPHLARSYHHLFPVATFAIEEADSAASEAHPPSCRSCCLPLPAAECLRLRCPDCAWLFCIACDEYVHFVLHNCPGCLSTPSKAASSGASGDAASSTRIATAASSTSAPMQGTAS